MSRRTERRRIFAKRYKTELCSAFMDTGVCQFAHKCVFAHGLHELRTEEDNVAQGLTSDEIVDRITSVQPSVAKSTPTSRDGTASKGKPASSPTSGRHSAAARSILPTLPTNRPQPTAHAQPPTPTEPETTSPTTTVTALVLSSKQDLVILSPHSSPKTPLSVKSILDQSNNGTTSSASSRTDSVSMFAPTSPSTSTAHHPYDASAGGNARTYFSGATEVRVRRHNPYAPLPSASVQ